MKKKLRLFKRLETLKKKDILKDQHQSNLISKEIIKTNDLIYKIDQIISENSKKQNGMSISGAMYKNQSNLVSTLNEQKNIANNKNDFLNEQNKICQLNIAKKNKDKKIINEKYKEKLNNYLEELDKKI